MTQTNLAALFKLFSIAFEPPSMTLGELVVSGALRDDVGTVWEALELPERPLDEFRVDLAPYLGRDAEETMHELRRESTRLFLGDRPLVTNSEGLWRKRAEGKQKAVLIINSYSLEVADFMRSCGVVRAEGYNDCVDYVENECDFAAFLADGPQHLIDLGKDPLALLDEFVDDHLKRWLPGFCADVVRESDTLYYKGLGKLLDAFIAEF